MTLLLPNHVSIIEVGPRDGLQNETTFIPTSIKIDFIQAIKAAGIKEMEITSFVSPKWVPQMQDANVIVSSCMDKETRNLILVPNQKGIDRVMAIQSNAVAVFAGVSDVFNQKNSNKPTIDLLKELLPAITELKQKGFFVRACISTSFYCPYIGKIAEKETIQLCHQFVNAGVDELSVADTIGMASPSESYSLFAKILDAFPNTLITAHFHDTRKMALANIFASLQAGVHRFDTSAGGLGGCPFAPGATGNVATEDVVFMLSQMGIKTGVDLEKLMEAIEIVRPYLSRPIESGFYRIHSSKV